MSKSMATYNCARCAWFSPDVPDEQIGTCRRYPPRDTNRMNGPLSQRLAQFPMVFEQAWCGEFRTDPDVLDAEWGNPQP